MPRSLYSYIDEMIERKLRARGITNRRGPLTRLDEGQGGNHLYATVDGYPLATGHEQIEAALCEPFGHASRPPAQTGLVLIRSHDQYVAIAAEDRVHRPAMEDGELVLYNAHGAKIHLKNDGSVVMNEGTAKVARVGDSVSPTAEMSSWLATVSTFCSTTPPADIATISDNDATVKA